jgi:hypothetical protein
MLAGGKCQYSSRRSVGLFLLTWTMYPGMTCSSRVTVLTALSLSLSCCFSLDPIVLELDPRKSLSTDYADCTDFFRTVK